MTPLPNRFPILRAAAIGALALLVAMMALVHPASAEGVAASCATGGAVPDEASTGLVADCDALLVGSGHFGGERDSELVGGLFHRRLGGRHPSRLASGGGHGSGGERGPGESSHWCVDQHVLPVEAGVRGDSG